MPAHLALHVATRIQPGLPELIATRRLSENITPNWFASIMGTGIVATAAAGLPLQTAGLQFFATAVWMVAAAALLGLSAAFVTHWCAHRETARMHAHHPIMSQFYGALPMAVLTVGAGTLLVGSNVIGLPIALALDLGCWLLGTAGGVVTAVWSVRRHRIAKADGKGLLPAHLMPVVPPMVSASTGALLLPHLTVGWARLMTLGCYCLFAISILFGSRVLVSVVRRIVRSGPPAGLAAPTVWISLGLIGQSITAANLLSSHAAPVVGQLVGAALVQFALLYSAVVGAFGVLAFGSALLITNNAARNGLPFSLSWWSFTFPIGTCITGVTALRHTLLESGAVAGGPSALRVLAIGLYAILVVVWLTVATKTLRRSWSGQLFALS